MSLPSNEKLKDIINNHFNYEIIELANCKQFYKVHLEIQIQPAFTNMNLEHILLHSRNLWEFFYDLKPVDRYNEASYPRANMYITSFDRPAFTENIKDENEKLNEMGFYVKVCNQILHLGIDRTGQFSEKFKVPETIEIANDLLRITKDFLSRLEAIDNRFYFDTNDKNLDRLKSDIDTFLAL